MVDGVIPLFGVGETFLTIIFVLLDADDDEERGARLGVIDDDGNDGNDAVLLGDDNCW